MQMSKQRLVIGDGVVDRVFTFGILAVLTQRGAVQRRSPRLRRSHSRHARRKNLERCEPLSSVGLSPYNGQPQTGWTPVPCYVGDAAAASFHMHSDRAKVT
jgi:hypothetical protein